jgi:hypothetical protein
MGLAKKFLFQSWPVGIRSDIASKRGFFAGLCNVLEAKKVSRDVIMEGFG